MTAATSGRAARRLRVVRSMRPAVRAQYDRALELLADSSELAGARKYAAARIVRDVLDDSSTYGPHAFAQIAIGLGRSRSTLYAWALVPERFKPAEVTALLARKTGKGKPLTFSHVVIFAEIADAFLRAMWIGRAIGNAWSAQELRRMIRAESPRAATAALLRIARLSAKLIAEMESVAAMASLDTEVDAELLSLVITREVELLAAAEKSLVGLRRAVRQPMRSVG